MKTIIVTLLSFLPWIYSIAQETTGKDRIYIAVLQPERSEIPQEATKLLENTMKQLIASNGISGDDPCNRFVLTAKANIISKDIMAGLPQRISQRIDFTLIIGDAIENKIFETLTIPTTGVGINENKSFIAAIRSINPNNKKLVAFLEKAKTEIINYYTIRCEEIVQEANKLAAARKYDAAIYQLMLVPSICDCANQCQQLAIQYNEEKIINDAATLLNEAKAVWAKSPNANGAAAVADIITRIPANTPSQAMIDDLIKEINEKLRQDEKREWDFKMKQYNDRIEQEKREYQYRMQKEEHLHQYQMEQQRAENAIRQQQIEAYRQVGLEYAKNQPETVTLNYNRIILW